jgi:hypothetical protein
MALKEQAPCRPCLRSVRPALHYIHDGKFLLSLSDVHKEFIQETPGIIHDLTEHRFA